MSNQYCRYCWACCETDGGYWCGAKEKLMTEPQIKRANRCADYGYTYAGDVINPDQQYKPRGTYQKRVICGADGEQIKMEGV